MPSGRARGMGTRGHNTKAVIEAIIGKKSDFARKPKFKIEGKTCTFAAKKYKNKAGWMPYFEVALRLYFALTVLYAIINENYATLLFLLLFVWASLYTGVMPLIHSWVAH